MSDQPTSPSPNLDPDPSGRDPVVHAFGIEVRRTRHAREWSLDDLAEESGISRRMVLDVEHGRRNPSLLVILTLARALDVTVSRLVGPAEDLFARTRTLPGAARRRGDGPPEQSE
ncbi:helix-turn-helix transcriptional regulator [Embleya sp. NPDC005575]|uniref:helix-turn-helix domain-containing protein n=1 Tax=Embleya sp. NPDC005575 TaxID=3156892 RepID=UPI0033A61184